MTPTRFDIYVREQGRWQRLESMPGDDKAAAISRTVGIDSSEVYDGVRAMAVVEYEGGRPPLETLAWISPHLNKTASVQRQLIADAAAAEKAMEERRASNGDHASNDLNKIEAVPFVETASNTSSSNSNPVKDTRPKHNPRARSELELKSAGKVLGSAVISIAVTAVLYVPLAALVKGVGGQANANPDTLAGITLAMVVLLFVLISAILMSRVYREYQALAAKMADAPLIPKERLGTAARRPRQERRSLEIPKHEEAAPEDVEDDQSTPDASAEDKRVTDTSADAKGSLTANMRRGVLEFLAGALSAIKDEVPRMNQHVAFGLNLFGAGAAEQYGKESGLKRFQSFVLVREAVEVLGNSADRVDAFCRQYDEYSSREQYRMMIDAGREAMSRHIRKEADPFHDFSDILNMWTSNAAARAQSQGIVCIMFTDLVGSTQMTHERGDYGAQEVVRAHNAIVRSSLAAHHGREVKHTGDGIMASFTSAANAMRSAMNIRAELKRHNSAKDAIPVRVRIGLNAGEAVQEEDDFFGTTVQLAARVCDKAGEDEIFVTDNVRELSKGQGMQTEEAGKYEMKGVPQPMTLYRVIS